MSTLGGYIGGDPRKFHPDPEMSTPEEMRAHEEACKAWDRGEHLEPRTVLNGVQNGIPFHASIRPFGIGFTDQEEEPEEPEPDLELEEQDDEALLGLYLSNAGQDSDDAMRILADRHGLSISVEPTDDEEDDEEAAEG